LRLVLDGGIQTTFHKSAADPSNGRHATPDRLHDPVVVPTLGRLQQNPSASDDASRFLATGDDLLQPSAFVVSEVNVIALDHDRLQRGRMLYPIPSITAGQTFLDEPLERAAACNALEEAARWSANLDRPEPGGAGHLGDLVGVERTPTPHDVEETCRRRVQIVTRRTDG
jgi:hypothetical protein